MMCFTVVQILKDYIYIYRALLFVSLLLVSTTIRLHYNSSPLLFVSTQFVSLLFISNNSSPLLFVSTTFRLHYYSSPHNSSPYYSSPKIRFHYFSSPDNSSPLLFVFTTFCLHKIRLQQFVSTTIRFHYYSGQLQFHYI